MNPTNSPPGQHSPGKMKLIQKLIKHSPANHRHKTNNKMKKVLTMFFSFGLMLLAASCSDQDETQGVMPEPSAGDGQAEMTTFTCKIPTNLRSRGANEYGLFGDGKEATHLTAAIYERNFNTDELTYLRTQYATAKSDGTFEISIAINNGGNTEILFWADAWGANSGSPFTFDWNNTTVTVDYEKSLKMFDKADAFCLHWKQQEHGTDLLLYRPFAQINILTDELIDGDKNLMTTGFALGHNREGAVLPNSWNFATNEIGYTDAIDMATVPLPDFEAPTISIQGYPEGSKYCYMGYIFAPQNKNIWNQEVEQLYLYFNDGISISDTFSEITINSYFPVKANDRVIIYREEQSSQEWLTQQTKFTVDIESYFDNEYTDGLNAPSKPGDNGLYPN